MYLTSSLRVFYIKGGEKLHTFAIPNGNLVTSLAQCMSSDIFRKILAMCRENSSQYMSDLIPNVSQIPSSNLSEILHQCDTSWLSTQFFTVLTEKMPSSLKRKLLCLEFTVNDVIAFDK